MMRRNRQLIVATCQFPVTGDITQNVLWTMRQIEAAKSRGADVVHFSETCLSGYAGADFESLSGFNWDLLEESTCRVLDQARRLRVWVVLGSSHRLSGKHKPHNSLYIINDRGRIVDRYDKSFCTGDQAGRSDDLKHYSPGNHFCGFTIKGIRCGALICHDCRYQELYREYEQRGVELMFHSYHNRYSHLRRIARRQRVNTFSRANGNGSKRFNLWSIIVPATMQTYAANNRMWISVNNTGDRQSCWPGFFVRPDGIITRRLADRRPGMLISKVDPAERFYDASAAWRDRAIKGIYHSGSLVRDRRSADRTSL